MTGEPDVVPVLVQHLHETGADGPREVALAEKPVEPCGVAEVAPEGAGRPRARGLRLVGRYVGQYDGGAGALGHGGARLPCRWVLLAGVV